MKSPRVSDTTSDATGSIPLVVLVIGPEETLREAYVAALRERALGGGPRDFNEDRFDLAEGGSDPAQILAAARTLPILAPRRLVLVRGLEDRRARRFLEDLLPAYVEDPTPQTCLVLDARNVDRRQRWVKLVERAGELRDCRGPTRPAEVQRWIDARFRQAGKSPAAGTAAALFELVGPDLDRLGGEVEKACLFAGASAEVTPDDVAEVTGALRPLALYELTDAIGSRQVSPSLRMLARLLEQGEAPLAILGGLANHFRRLLRARECEPADARAIERALGVHPFAAQKLAGQVARFDARRLRRCLDAIHRTDAALKGAEPLPPRLALERLVWTVGR
jgi:DNA polymerase-3 subunit delta